jgi:hypothetical protein
MKPPIKVHIFCISSFINESVRPDDGDADKPSILGRSSGLVS